MDRRFLDRLRLEAKERMRRYREHFLSQYRRDETERENALLQSRMNLPGKGLQNATTLQNPQTDPQDYLPGQG